jgi:hypothetical protein
MRHISGLCNAVRLAKKPEEQLQYADIEVALDLAEEYEWHIRLTKEWAQRPA